MMKKFLTICMAVAMIFALAVNVFAAAGSQTNLQNDQRSDNIVVSVDVDTPDTSPTYNIEVVWEDLTFTYKTAYDSNWGTATSGSDTTYGYSERVPAEWTKQSGKVTVYNHSNRNITVRAELADVPDDDITVSLTPNENQQVPAPTAGSSYKSKYVEFDCSATGTPSADGQIATINIIIGTPLVPS